MNHEITVRKAAKIDRHLKEAIRVFNSTSNLAVRADNIHLKSIGIPLEDIKAVRFELTNILRMLNEIERG